ncbi:MAG: hypothetical protein AAFU65_17335, partial [Pseudomonadota bacterium]
MYLLFILVSLLGALWFGWARRSCDLFTVAYGTSCLYFMPGYFGFALMLPTPSRPYKLPIALVDDVYLVMLCVLCAI